jgi:hypothetical protein
MASVKIKANCYHCDKEFERGKYDINEYEEYINTHS